MLRHEEHVNGVDKLELAERTAKEPKLPVGSTSISRLYGPQVRLRQGAAVVSVLEAAWKVVHPGTVS